MFWINQIAFILKAKHKLSSDQCPEGLGRGYEVEEMNLFSLLK